MLTILPQSYVINNSPVLHPNIVCRDPDLLEIPLDFMLVHYINDNMLAGPS